jgi:hypothetical protein
MVNWLIDGDDEDSILISEIIPTTSKDRTSRRRVSRRRNVARNRSRNNAFLGERRVRKVVNGEILSLRVRRVIQN